MEISAAGDEADGMDETILPVDFATAGMLVDDVCLVAVVTAVVAVVAVVAAVGVVVSEIHTITTGNVQYLSNSFGPWCQANRYRQPLVLLCFLIPNLC